MQIAQALRQGRALTKDELVECLFDDVAMARNVNGAMAVEPPSGELGEPGQEVVVVAQVLAKLGQNLIAPPFGPEAVRVGPWRLGLARRAASYVYVDAAEHLVVAHPDALWAD